MCVCVCVYERPALVSIKSAFPLLTLVLCPTKAFWKETDSLHSVLFLGGVVLRTPRPVYPYHAEGRTARFGSPTRAHEAGPMQQRQSG